MTDTTAADSTKALFREVLEQHAKANGNGVVEWAKRHPVWAGVALLAVLGVAPPWVQDLARSLITGQENVQASEVKKTVEGKTDALAAKVEAETKRADDAHQLLDDKIKADSHARMIEDGYQTKMLESISKVKDEPEKRKVEEARAAAKRKLDEPLPRPAGEE